MLHRPTTWLLLLGVTLTCHAACSDDPDERPVAVYAELNGRWKGVFKGYDETGKELYRIEVEQEYETVDAQTQKVTVRDRMPDGKVITGEGENTARRLEDGTLELKCLVRKSNGEKVEHNGRLVKGPDGDRQLVWFSKKKGRIETFREVVRVEGTETVYSIDGMGQYGETFMLMHGRYRKR